MSRFSVEPTGEVCLIIHANDWGVGGWGGGVINPCYPLGQEASPRSPSRLDLNFLETLSFCIITKKKKSEERVGGW